MMNRDAFDGLMQLAEFHFKKFDTRRSYEWKISLGLWGAILASVAIVGDSHLPIVALWVTVPVSFAIIGAYWFLWLKPLTKRNKLAQEAEHYFQRQAELVLGPLDKEREEWFENS